MDADPTVVDVSRPALARAHGDIGLSSYFG